MRENTSSYRQKRGRKAVGSHSNWGVRSPSGRSAYIYGEALMSSGLRKEMILPCKYSVKSTWAALRKCWLGFNISLSNNDQERMSEYAFRIRKLQRQLGIEATNFTSDILDEKTRNQIDAEHSVSVSWGSDLREDESNSGHEERTVDYDGLLDKELLTEQTRERASAPPRKSIFASYVSHIDKSCPSPSNITRSNVEKFVINYEKFCPGPSELEPETGQQQAQKTFPVKIQKLVTYGDDKVCFARIEDQNAETVERTPNEIYDNGGDSGKEGRDELVNEVDYDYNESDVDEGDDGVEETEAEILYDGNDSNQEEGNDDGYDDKVETGYEDYPGSHSQEADVDTNPRSSGHDIVVHADKSCTFQTQKDKERKGCFYEFDNN